MKLKLRKPIYELEEGGLLPRGFGIAYYEYYSNHVICYPIPLNLFINWGRKLYYKIIGPSIPDIEKRLHRAYTKGVKAGWKAHKTRMEEELERFLTERRRKR